MTTTPTTAATKTIADWFSRVEGLRVVQVNPKAAKPTEETPPYQKLPLKQKHVLEIGGQQASIEHAPAEPNTPIDYKHPERLVLYSGSRTYYFEAYRT